MFRSRGQRGRGRRRGERAEGIGVVMVMLAGQRARSPREVRAGHSSQRRLRP